MSEKFSVGIDNKLAYWLSNFLLILPFSNSLFRNISRSFGMPTIEMFMGWTIIVLSVFVFVQFLISKKCRCMSVSFLFLYIIYTLFCIYYIVINPQLQRVEMLGVPNDNYRLFQSIITLSLQIFAVPYIWLYFDAKLFARFLSVIPTVYLPYYFLTIDTSYYVLEAMSDHVAHEELFEMISVGYIEPFTLSHITGMAIISSIYLIASNRQSVKTLVFSIVSLIINTYGLILAGKRGPLIMLIATVVLFFSIRGLLSKKKMIFLFIILFLILAFFDNIIYFFIQNDFSSGMIDRFSQTLDNGGSHRFGDTDSEYVVAIKQINEEPILGSYFRSLEKGFTYGHYPHNFILESLMTFGILFAIPFMAVIYKAIVQAFKYIKTNTPFLLVALLYVFFILCYLTSGTMFLSIEFWIPLALVIGTIKNDNLNKTYKYENNL